MNDPDPILCSAFVFVAFVLAGIAQTLWLKSGYSQPFGVALDGQRTFRGHRIFGDNKTWRGFVVMVPVAGISFVLTRFLFQQIGAGPHGPWQLSAGAYLLLGGWVGFGFLLGELPNSFLKRQCGIGPGAAPEQPLARTCCFTVDQVDSVAGGLLALSLFVPVPLLSWLYVLVIGGLTHWGFNYVFMLIGLKATAS